MILWKHLVLLILTVCLSCPVSAQNLLPDSVMIGTGRIYWVDSTAYPGSFYIWSIDGNIVQSGTKCALAFTWKTAGVYELTLRQLSANGCSGDLQSGMVYVESPPGILVYPNPSTGLVHFRITGDADSWVSLDLYTVTGRFLSPIFSGRLPGQGSRLVTYSGLMDQLPHGVYVYRGFIGTRLVTGRIVLVTVYE